METETAAQPTAALRRPLESTALGILLALSFSHLLNDLIQSLIPDRATRVLLRIPTGEPVLQVRRRTWSGGAVVSSARLIHPGSSYSLVGRFKVNRRATP